jgi:hypothetical protein
VANSIVIDEGKWLEIYNSIAREYPRSYLLIREVQRRELGFNVRRHNGWVKDDDIIGHYESQIVLDFYDDSKETWFRMKYL